MKRPLLDPEVVIPLAGLQDVDVYGVGPDLGSSQDFGTVGGGPGTTRPQRCRFHP